MRVLILSSIIFMTSCTMPNENPVPYSIKDISEFGWTVAEGQTSDYPYQIRFREFPSDFQRKSYPIRLNIFWKMSSPDKMGLASAEDIDLMHKFEDRIIEATESSGISVVSAVLTGRGEREFVIYASSRERLMTALRNMSQESERYPIEIYSYEDSEWTYYDNETVGIQ